jgi:hypothetical protein
MTVLLDAAGRRRSPATMPGYHAGRPPRNKGISYPADPPMVEEFVAVMRHAADDRHGWRVRAMIVVLWRAGLRVEEALALTENDLDSRRGSVLFATAKEDGDARSAWTIGVGSSCGRGWTQGQHSRSVPCSASSTAPPAGDPGRAPRSAPSSAGWPPKPGSGAASRRTSCATRTRSSSPARGCSSTSSSAVGACESRDDLDLPARHRPRGDHHRRAHAPRADDVRQRRAQALT